MHALVSTDVIRRGDRGGIACFVSFVQDITERRRAEQELQESQRALKSIIANLQGFVYRCRNDEKWTMLFMSPGVKELAGYGPDDLVDNARICFSEVIHPDDRSFVYEEVQGALHRDEQYQLTYRICTAEGTVKWVLEKGMGVYAPDGSLAFLEGFITDITERKLAEQELQAKNAELQRFTNMVSHDLRSPLITIRTYAGQLAKNYARGEGRLLAQDLGYIQSAGETMSRMLDDLLEFSRFGSAAQPPAEATLQNIVREALVMTAGRIAQKNVRVSIAVEPVPLYGNISRLRDIFQNLIDNAVKFMGGQPEPGIEIGADVRGGFVECYVRDNGRGIDPSIQDKIFDLFKKFDSPSEGAGMGLALVKRIVEVHGGRIWVESAGRGAGACFRFTLPRRVPRHGA